MKWKTKKTTCVFLYIKYGKFWSVSQGHYVEHKPLISEEWCTVKIFEHAFVVCFPREPRELFQSDLMINYNYFWYVQYFKVSVYFLCIVCHFGCLELLNVWLRSCIKCIFLNKFLMPSWMILFLFLNHW